MASYSKLMMLIYVEKFPTQQKKNTQRNEIIRVGSSLSASHPERQPKHSHRKKKRTACN